MAYLRLVLALSLLTSTAFAGTVSTLHRLGGRLDGITVAGDGRLFVSTAEGGEIRQIAVDGSVTTVHRGGNQYFVGLAVKDGDLYAAEFNRGQVVRFEGASAAPIAQVAGAGDLIVDRRDGALLVASTRSNTVNRIGSDGQLSVLGSVPGVLGLAQDDSGRIYGAGLFDAAISRIEPSGAVTRLAQLTIPGQYKIGHLEYAAGYLWATGIGDHRIYRISLDGDVRLIAGDEAGWSDGPSATATFRSPNGIVHLPGSRRLVISEYDTGVIRALDLDSADVLQIHRELNGFWYDPAIPDQGISVEVYPDRVIGLAWYTYDAEARPHWFTASGSYRDAEADLVLYASTGGRRGESAPSTTAPAGTLSVTFASCSAAVVQYHLNGGESGSLALSRLGDSAPCEAVMGR